jgi:signal peptidase I
MVIACFVLPILLVLALGLFIRVSLIVVTVDGQSMSPTLEPGDRAVVLRHWPRAWLRRGHIVLILPYSEERRSQRRSFSVDLCIKRVVGLPSDMIATHITELKEHDRLRVPWVYDSQGWRFWHIPPGHLFIRGDNRAESIDSLSWGPVSFGGLQGLMVMKLPRRNEPDLQPAAVREPNVAAEERQ